ncbi:unnamed protein product [Lactuca saligna]|uniref:Uncharacterized protein n=1 Tax=Lactuca saligna TaxID=75948 RepID=A0AA35ZKL2_LACSI|nr:unnamed protein product [Lactuca saligna]
MTFRLKDAQLKIHFFVNVKNKSKSNPKVSIVKEVSKEVVKDTKKEKSKPKGVVIKDINEEVQKKKRKAMGLLKRFSNIRAQTNEYQYVPAKLKKKILDQEEVLVETDDEETDTEGPTSTPISINKCKGNPNATVFIYDEDTNILNPEIISTSDSRSTSVIPPKGPTTNSNMEEDMSSNISDNLFNKDSNVNMGENPSTYAQYSSNVLPPPSSPPQTSTISPMTIPINYPTFEGILEKPISTLFSSQSTNQDLRNNKEDERIWFVQLEFDPEEEEIKDQAIMYRNPYRILNSKLNMIL